MSQDVDTFARECGIALDSCDMCRLTNYRESDLRGELQAANMAVFRLQKLADQTKRRADYCLMGMCVFAAATIYLGSQAAGWIK